MTPDKIVDAVESLPDLHRWHYMLALGHRASTEPLVRNAIAALAAAPNFYHRRLAMMATCVAVDQDIICANLQGPSSRLSSFACHLAALHVDDDAIVRVLPDLARSRRRRLVRACAAAGRTAPVDRVFDRLSLNERCELAAYASADLVRSKLAEGEFADMLSPLDWSRLAQHHPDIARPALVARDAGDEAPSWHLVQTIGQAMRRVMPTQPDAALEMLRHAAKTLPMRRLPYNITADQFPAETALLVLADHGEVVPNLAPRILRRIDVETGAALVSRGVVGLSTHTFRCLPPALRHGLYVHGALEAFRDQFGALEIGYVGKLREAARVTEAQRAWIAPGNLATPERRLPYLAFLPFDDAMRLASEFVAQPDAGLRATAGAAVVASARFAPERLSDALTFVRSRKNEQDPVRLQLINALARLPPTRWSAAHLVEISKVIDDALAARDCSAQTIGAAAYWLIGLAPVRIQFVAQELSRLSERLGQVPSVDLESKVSDAQMPALTPHLLPLLELWRARDYNGPVLSLLGNFGRRLLVVPQLLDLVERMTDDKRRHIAEGALMILTRLHAKTRIAALVPRLLSKDPSWILSPSVANHIGCDRQDLLNEYLRPRVYQGLFSTNEAAALPAFGRCFASWSEKQQSLYAQSLLAIANSSQRSAWELRNCLHTLAAMPAIDPTPIVELAQVGTKDTALRDMAVVCLGQLDDARGMPCLTEALGDDRGRVAIYALRKIMLRQAPDRVVSILSTVPMQKVTVAKEVMRLAGELDSEDAYRFLGQFVAKRDLHKDVRIAVMRALWSYLERPETWDLFAEAARGDAAAAIATVRVPQDRLSTRARASLAQHMAMLLSHQDPRVRRVTLQRLFDYPVAAAGSELGSRLRGLLGTSDAAEAHLAAAALLLSSRVDASAELAENFAAIENPRILQAAIGALIERAPFQLDRVQPTAARLVDILLAKRKQICLAVRLAVHTLQAPALHAVLDSASASGVLHAGALMEVLAALPMVARRRRGGDIEALEMTFADGTDPAVRRIGLAILTERASTVGWTKTARERLAAYRGDPDALVHEAAWLTFPPDQPSTGQT